MYITSKTVTSISINGNSYAGKNISINGDKVIVDGVEQPLVLPKKINITVEGNVHSVTTTSGNIKAKDVVSVQTTSGDIECSNVAGSVSTVSGDVVCNDISGKASTVSGDIIYT